MNRPALLALLTLSVFGGVLYLRPKPPAPEPPEARRERIAAEMDRDLAKANPADQARTYSASFLFFWRNQPRQSTILGRLEPYPMAGSHELGTPAYLRRRVTAASMSAARRNLTALDPELPRMIESTANVAGDDAVVARFEEALRRKGLPLPRRDADHR
jgi:hypothetical protein